MNDNKNPSLKSFKYEDKNNKSKKKKSKSKSKLPLFNINETDNPAFPNIGGNEIIKIIPVNRRNNHHMQVPDLNEIFKMLIDSQESKEDSDELEDIEQFKISLEKDYDELDVNISNLDKLIDIAKNLDIKKDYSFDIKKLKKLISPLEKLKDFVGMNKVKDNIVKQILYFLQNLDDTKDLMHTVITGPPGVG